jgi:hypothetical protein
MASISASPNGSGQSIGKISARASPRNLPLRRSSISPMNSMPVLAQGRNKRFPRQCGGGERNLNPSVIATRECYRLNEV